MGLALVVGRVLITGSGGFAGRALCKALAESTWQVTPLTRQQCDLTRDDIMPFCAGQVAIIHLAGRAHRGGSKQTFERENLFATQRLVEAAKQAGVKRFIFASSIGVLGGATTHKAFSEVDTPNPHTPYAESKWQAEQWLQQQANDGFSVVTLRLPLMVGASPKGNLSQLQNIIRRGWPLPLGSIHNRRDLLSLGNFCEAVARLLAQENPAPHQLFLLADGTPVSTPHLVQTMAHAMGKPAFLLPCPVWLLALVGKLAGKQRMVQSLTASLEIDSSAIRMALNWQPRQTTEAAIQKAFGGSA